MTNSQLQKSSLFSLLNETGTQQAEGRVRSTSLMEEMSLIGFIPYTDNYMLQMNFGMKIDLDGHLYVAPYLVRFSKDTPVYPYFKTITKATGKQYKMDENLYIDSLLDEIPSCELNNIKFKLPLQGSSFIESIKGKLRIKRILIEKKLLVQNDDNTFNYIGREGEWELSNGLESLVSISNNFLCLCSYMNKVTGKPSYAVLRSDDTIRVLSKQEAPNPFGA